MLGDRAAGLVRVAGAGRRPRGRRRGRAARGPRAAAPGPPRRLPARQLRPHPRCRRPGRLATVQRAAERRDPVGHAGSPRPGTATAPPGPSSATVTTSRPSMRSASTSIEAGVACLRALARASLTDEVRRRLDLGREPLVGHVQHRPHRRAAGELGQRRAEAGVEGATGGRRGPARAARGSRRPGGVRSRRAGRAAASAGLEAGLQVPQVEADGDELLLGAVVEVALEPAPLVEGGGDDAGPRALDLGELPAHLHPQAGDLDRQPGAGRAGARAAAYGRCGRRARRCRAAGPRGVRACGRGSTGRSGTQVPCDVGVRALAPAASSRAARCRRRPRAPRVSPTASGSTRPARRSARKASTCCSPRPAPRVEACARRGPGRRRADGPERHGHRRASRRRRHRAAAAEQHAAQQDDAPRRRPRAAR